MLALGALATPARADDRLPVVDLCALKPDPEADRSVVQRLLLFRLGGTERAEAGEVVVDEKGEEVGARRTLAEVGAARHLADVFLTTFPLKRFHNVVAPEPAPEGWAQAESLSRGEVRRVLSAMPSGRFLAYSADCVEYLAVPWVADFRATWKRTTRVVREQGKKDRRVVEWALEAVPRLKLAVFRREGARFERVAVVEAEGGGVFDFATDTGAAALAQSRRGAEAIERGLGVPSLPADVDAALREIDALERRVAALTAPAHDKEGASAVAGALQQADAVRETVREALDRIEQLKALVEEPLAFQRHAHALAVSQALGWEALVSGLPGDDCAVPLRGADGRAALPACAAVAHDLPRREVGLAGLSERSGPHCKGVDPERPETVARCVARVRCENATLLLQKEAKGIDGWRLWAPLLRGPAVALGRTEGVRRGDVFLAVDGRGGERGFAKVTAAGPGGPEGDAEPSSLRWRAGGAPTGTRLEEHPRIGLSLAFLPTASVFADTTIRPKLAVLAGGDLEVRYDMSHLVPVFHELWLRTQMGVVLAADPALETARAGARPTQITVAGAFSGPEAKIHLVPRTDLLLFVGAGWTGVRAALEREGDEDPPVGQGGAAGLVGSLGVDVLLGPSWYFRALGTWRHHFGDIRLSAGDDDEPVYEDTEIGTLTGLYVSAGLGVVF